MKKNLILVSSLICFFTILAKSQNVTINYNQKIGEIPENICSLNLTHSIDPNAMYDTVYKKYIKALQLPMIRIHGWQMIDKNSGSCWIDFPGKGWNKTVISQSLQAIVPNVGENIIINIPGEVDFITTDDEYAAYCANLVDIVNIQLGYKVKYWEPFNERQDDWSLQTTVSRFNKCAIAMKNIDPTIKVGGPAVNQPWWNDFGMFLKECKSNIDFVTYHLYGGGDGTINNQKIYNQARTVGNAAVDVRNTMNSNGISKSVPLFLGEYNIVWSWDLDPEGKQGSNVSAVFDAIVLKNSIESGTVQSIQAWNDKDGAYGKIDEVNNRRPGYYNLLVSTHYLKGDWFYSLASEDSILLLATKTDSTHTIMFINTSESDRTINVDFTGFDANGKNYTLHRIKHEYTVDTGFWDSSIKITSESVYYLVFKDNTISKVNKITDKITESRVYPNPSSGMVYLDCHDFRQGFISCYDLKGNQIYSKEISDRLEILNFAGYKGCILIKLLKDQQSDYCKVIIQ